MNQEPMNRAADELRNMAHTAAGRLDFGRYSRARRRRSAAMFTLAVTGFVLLLMSTALLTRVEPDETSPITPSTTTPTTTTPPTTLATELPALPIFAPETRHWGTNTVVPIGFVDGTTAELSYPDQYDFLSDGIELQGAFEDSGTGRTFTIRYGTIVENVARQRAVAGRAERLATYPDPRGGTAELWSFAPDDTADYLFVSLGNWTLQTWDYHANRSDARDETLADWVQSLGGYVADNGYPVLAGGGSLEIVPVLGDTGGPDGPDLMLNGADGTIMLYPDQCQYVTGDGYNSGNNSLEWCDVATNTRVVAFGNSSVVHDMMDNLTITGVTNRAYEATLTQKPYVANNRSLRVAISPRTGRRASRKSGRCGCEAWRRVSAATGPPRRLPLSLSGQQPSRSQCRSAGPTRYRICLIPSQWNQGNYRVNPDYGVGHLPPL